MCMCIRCCSGSRLLVFRYLLVLLARCDYFSCDVRVVCVLVLIIISWNLNYALLF